MNEIRPLLSICIPTYNRSAYLRKSIESLITQNEFNEQNVEIVISDNCSTDDTEKVVSEFTSKYKNIIYHKNEVNVRDKNFPIVLGEAHGLFRKLSNDTIIYKNGSLNYLLQLIKNNKDEKPFLFFMNGSKTKYNKKSDCVVVNSLEDFLYATSFYITWIAGLGLWNDDCIEIQNDFSGCELLLWQVNIILKKISYKNKGLIINKILFNTQEVEKKDISYGLYQVFYENYLNKLISPYYKNGIISTRCFNWLEKDLLYHFFTNWLIKYETKCRTLLFSDKEDLKTSVLIKYNNKKYFNTYILYYKSKYIIQMIRNEMILLYS